jgi:hypothetical protein
LKMKRFPLKGLNFFSMKVSIQIYFPKKNNKTLHDTINHRRYKKLSKQVRKDFSDCLDWELGKFLLHLKQLGNSFYKTFSINTDTLLMANFV